MLNFPQYSPDQLHKLHSQLSVRSPTDQAWQGAVTQLLQDLINVDLQNHRTFVLEKMKAQDEEDDKLAKQDEFLLSKEDFYEDLPGVKKED